ncbi:hypothetical protein Clow_01441 [Corynebacterium lowii]|uniref:Uncharacterized protein n=1 Tax=Corynebacterium lowii TaxID=1544413 RepID=A0A0Q0YUR5_9CORY|nr:hypothetical protein Clow_01441 [Corynebacterium lowii]
MGTKWFSRGRITCVMILGAGALVSCGTGEGVTGEDASAQAEASVASATAQRTEEEKRGAATLATVTSVDTAGSGTTERNNVDACGELVPLAGTSRIVWNSGDAGPGDTIVEYCDGQWAHPMLPHTSRDFSPLRWDGSAWQPVPSAGTLQNTSWSCWDTRDLAAQGAPQEIIDSVIPCAGERSAQENASQPRRSNPLAGVESLAAYEQPQCDGRYITIVESVVLRERLPGEDQVVQQRLDNYPGAKTTTPGACPSLRATKPDSQGRSFVDAEYDGGYIIPIYYDYGADRAAACSAAQRSSGAYARQLTQVEGDYNNPCS